MAYTWLKVLHLLAAALWVGGLLAASLAVAFHVALTTIQGRPLLAGIRRWNRWVTSPAMLVVLAAGATIALQAGWLVMSWLRIKLALVLGLVVLHVLLARALRRMASADQPIVPGAFVPGALLQAAAPLIVLVASCIVALAFTKLF